MRLPTWARVALYRLLRPKRQPYGRCPSCGRLQPLYAHHLVPDVRGTRRCEGIATTPENPNH